MTMKHMAVVFITVLTADLIAFTKAHEFLRISSGHGPVGRVSKDDIRSSLLKEIESSLPDALGTSSASKRYAELETALRPIFDALPKNEHDNLDHTAASYALHRMFVSRHGWSITGLGPTSGRYNSSSPAGILKDQVPSYIEDLFNERLGGKGFKLHDLAVLAATIEHLIHDDAVQRLGAAFKIFDTHQTGMITSANASAMLDTYMAGFILSEDLTNMTPRAASRQVSDMPSIFNYWNETQEFVRGVKDAVTENANRSRLAQMDFEVLTEVVESVNEKFGSFFHDTVCTQLKDRLMSMEYRQSGRIKLSEFYKPALDGNWQFQESPTYLREIGALEETEGKEPSVLIANYMASPSNCIASTGFYSVCCKNECEQLHGRLEAMIKAPEASPALIAVLSATLPSSTSRPRGVLPSDLRRRLDEIALHHNGTVPLHGRLFAQFMHHRYPHECPYPHLSGSTSSKLPEDWLTDSAAMSASEEEMLQYTQWSSSFTESGGQDSELITWAPEEELLVVKPIISEAQPGQSPWATAPSILGSARLWVGAVLFACVLTRTARTFQSGFQDIPEKFVV